MHRSQRKNNPDQPDWYRHIRFSRLIPYVAHFKGWPVALGCAAAGIGVTAALIALAIGGTVLAIYLGQDFKPAPLAAGALIGFATNLVIGEILLRRRPWRGPLRIAATAGGHRRPGTLGLSYSLPAAAVHAAKHRLLSAGFEHVNCSWPGGDDPSATGKIEVLVRLRPERGIDSYTMQSRANELMHRLGVPFTSTGSSQS